MPVAYQGTSAAIGAATTAADPVVSWPTVHAVDDLGLLITAIRSGSETCSTPSGWTLINNFSGVSWTIYGFWKRATSTAEANVTVPWDHISPFDTYAVIHTVRGALNTGDPFDTNNRGVDATDPIVVGGVVTGSPGLYIGAAALGSDDASTFANASATDPSFLSQNSFLTSTVGADATSGFFSAVQTAAGATGSITLDFNNTMPFCGVIVVAIKGMPISVGIPPVVIPMGTGIAQI